MNTFFSGDLSRNIYIASMVNQGQAHAQELRKGNEVKDRRRRQEVLTAAKEQFLLLTQTAHTKGFTA